MDSFEMEVNERVETKTKTNKLNKTTAHIQIGAGANGTEWSSERSLHTAAPFT